MSEMTSQALSRALYKVLRPMVRLLMRHGVSFKFFSDIARHVFVDVAETDFALPGRKPSNSRTAVLTGINRKDIAKLKERPHPLSVHGAETPNPASRIVTGWLNDERFHDAAGKPLALEIEDNPQQPQNFTTLARQYSSDVPVRALIDELLRIKAIARNGNTVSLLVTGYVPIADMKENLRIFGTAAADLLNTMDHNISREMPGPHLQRTVSYKNIAPEDLEEIRRRCRAEGEALLMRINDWLCQYERQQTPLSAHAQSFRAGLGIYYLESSSTEGNGDKKVK